MPRLDELPPDLRATLSLLVDRGKTYTEVATLLGISEQAVRTRAHSALDQLAGGSAEPTETPRAAGTPHAGRTATPTGTASTPMGSSGAGAGGAFAEGAVAARGAASPLPVSRRAGALLLAGLVVVIVVVVVLVSGGGGGGSGTNGNASAHTSSTTASKTGSGKTPAVTNQLALTATEPGSKAIGLAEVLAEGTQHAIIVAAEHLAPSKGFYYLVWLYNSPSSATPIGRAPTVGSNGRLQGGALLPGNAGAYDKILITRETAAKPTAPGQAVLSGKFSLSG